MLFPDVGLSTRKQNTGEVILQTCRLFLVMRGRRGRYRMVVGFTTTYAISIYHHYNGEVKPRLLWGVLDTTLCDKVCQ